MCRYLSLCSHLLSLDCINLTWMATSSSPYSSLLLLLSTTTSTARTTEDMEIG